MLLPVFGFTFTVLFGLFNAPRRQRWSGQPGSPFAWAPFRLGPWLFVIVVALLSVIPLMSLLSKGHGLPDIGNRGLLLSRDHYDLSDHGVHTPVERWRFVTLGVLFFSLWCAGGSAAAGLVFFKRAPSVPPESG